MDRKAPCPCGSGRKYKDCCYAKDRARADVLESARSTHERIDQATRIALPLVVAQGHQIACTAGCNACCKSFIRTTFAEAQLIAAWLREPEHADVRARFEAAWPNWREQLAGELELLDELLRRHGGAPGAGDDRDRFAAAVSGYQAKQIFCPLNDASGRCEIYPVRPSPCRATNVVDTAEFCTPGRGRGPSVVRHPDLQQAISDGRTRMLEAARKAAPSEPAERSLPDAVAAALGLTSRSA